MPYLSQCMIVYMCQKQRQSSLRGVHSRAKDQITVDEVLPLVDQSWSIGQSEYSAAAAGAQWLLVHWRTTVPPGNPVRGLKQ